MKWYFLILWLFTSLVQGQSIDEIDREVLNIEELLSGDGKKKVISIEQEGKSVAITRYEFNDQPIKLTASFYEGDFRLIKTFYLVDGDLFFHKTQKVLGDDIARLEEAKSEKMSDEELRRAAETKSAPDEYYFRSDDLFFSRASGRPLSGEDILGELKFFLSQFN